MFLGTVQGRDSRSERRDARQRALRPLLLLSAVPAAQLGQAAQLQRREAWLQAKPAPLLPLSRMLHAWRAAAAKSAMSVALPAADVREAEPLGRGSRGSDGAAALEQLALRSEDLCDLQASSRGAG